MRGSEALAFRGVQQGLWVVDGSVLDREPGSDHWRLDDLFGRLVELSGGAAGAVLTLAFRLVREAQQRGEPVAWITGRDRTFFPPDVAEGGVDLAALAVVRLPSQSQSQSESESEPQSSALALTPALVPRAVDLLVRSGGFGLLVMDLDANAELPSATRPSATLPIAIQSRLAGLAKRHHTALLCLTRKPREAPSLGSLVSLRGEVLRKVVNREEGRGEEAREEFRDDLTSGIEPGRYRLAVRTLKSKGPAFAKAMAGSAAFADAKAAEELCHAPDGLC